MKNENHEHNNKILKLPLLRFHKGQIKLSGSKSISNRVLLLASFGKGKILLRGISQSDDTRLMIKALRQLSISIDEYSQDELFVHGSGEKMRVKQGRFFCGNAGTMARFLIPILASQQGDFEFYGQDRLHERPMRVLLESLQTMGAEISYLKNKYSLPLQLTARGLEGGHVELSAKESSQFISGLILASPFFANGLKLKVNRPIVSESYVKMTVKILQDFAIAIDQNDKRYYCSVRPQQQLHNPPCYSIEPDVSSASYFFALAAITGGAITVENIHRDSIQGDVKFLHILAAMGCRYEWHSTGITLYGPQSLMAVDVDMNDISDTVPTLATVALFAEGTSYIRNVKHIRWKESDRLSVLTRELRKFGADIRDTDDGLEIKGGKSMNPACVNPENDHRIAMALTLLACRINGVTIACPECVSKTFPNFFSQIFACCHFDEKCNK